MPSLRRMVKTSMHCSSARAPEPISGRASPGSPCLTYLREEHMQPSPKRPANAARNRASSGYSGASWSGAGWVGPSWLSNAGAFREKWREEGIQSARERSRLCPGFMIPPYIAWRLSRPVRASLRRNTLPASARISTDIDRPLRFFFENGLEVRIIPGDAITVRAIYHTHPWLLHRQAKYPTPRPARPAFEVVEETIACIFASWNDRDPELSNHQMMQLSARRRDAGAAIENAECFDATLVRTIQVSAPDRTIHIERPQGRGLSLRHAALGRNRLEATPMPAASKADASKIGARLQAAASQTNLAISSLPLGQRMALSIAADLAPFFYLLEEGTSRLASWVSSRFRARPKTPSSDGTKTGNFR